MYSRLGFLPSVRAGGTLPVFSKIDEGFVTLYSSGLCIGFGLLCGTRCNEERPCCGVCVCVTSATNVNKCILNSTEMNIKKLQSNFKIN